MKNVNTSELTKSVIASRLTAVAKQSPVTVFALAFLLASCGDDSSKGTEPVNDSSSSSTVSDIVTDTFADLPVCVDKREGATAYVKDEKVAYICVDGDWTPDSEVQSSASVNKESSSSVALTSSSSDKDEATSSGSDKANSSSDTQSDGEGSSSSKVPASTEQGQSEPAEGSCSSTDSSKSSSSVGKDSNSSSSLVIPSSNEESSSSIGEAASSSSSFELNCSVFSEGESGWNWDVPKECRFNSTITYGSMTDPRDKKVYKTVKIGDQTWMAENLNYADSTKTPSLLERSWCYSNKVENCDVAGRLYTWAAAIDSVKLATAADNPQDCGYGKTCSLSATVRGICPDGWHLPTKTEWETLFDEVGGQSTAGKILKSQAGWYNNGNGTDAYGFSALPAGLRYYTGIFDGGGDYAYFWSATENFNQAYYMYLYSDNEDANLYAYYKDYAYSVRCLKD